MCQIDHVQDCSAGDSESLGTDTRPHRAGKHRQCTHNVYLQTNHANMAQVLELTPMYGAVQRYEEAKSKRALSWHCCAHNTSAQNAKQLLAPIFMMLEPHFLSQHIHVHVYCQAKPVHTVRLTDQPLRVISNYN